MFRIVYKEGQNTVYLRHVDLADGGAYLHWCQSEESAQVFASFEEAKTMIDDYGLDEDFDATIQPT